MTRASSKGTCSFCKESFAKQAITRHLLACKAKPEDNDAVDVKKSAKGPAGGAVFHIMVEAKHWPVFWMHLEVPEQATLQDLDEFLRAIWLECCGHLRSFEIGGETFFSERMEPGDRSMRVRLGKVIAPGMTFEHIYDFGTSTELLLKVISARVGSTTRDKSVSILARNDPPDIRCECGELATAVCAECVYEGGGWLCDSCAAKHKCGEDMLLPVVNSPRVGMCGYTG